MTHVTFIHKYLIEKLTFGFHEVLEIFILAERLLASQERL
jgi:hypothetical protein